MIERCDQYLGDIGAGDVKAEGQRQCLLRDSYRAVPSRSMKQDAGTYYCVIESTATNLFLRTLAPSKGIAFVEIERRCPRGAARCRPSSGRCRSCSDRCRHASPFGRSRTARPPFPSGWPALHNDHVRRVEGVEAPLRGEEAHFDARASPIRPEPGIPILISPPLRTTGTMTEHGTRRSEPGDRRFSALPLQWHPRPR